MRTGRLYDLALFKQRLATRRAERGLSQANLATLICCSDAYIARLESATDRAMPGLEYLTRLAEVLQVSTDYLLGVKSVEHLDKHRQVEFPEALAKLPAFRPVRPPRKKRRTKKRRTAKRSPPCAT